LPSESGFQYSVCTVKTTVLTLLTGATLLAGQFLADLELRSLAFDAREFKASFNQAQDRLRLVLVFSPT